MTSRKYALIYGSLTVALVAVVGVAVVFGSPEGDDIGLPEPIERITPLPNETVLRQARIEIDMPIGYELEVFIDNWRVPESELVYVEGTGVYSWSPGTGGTPIEWERGEHTVLIRWNTVTGLADVGEYQWSFRVY